ncbi:hypothetical protein DFH29DRAFT_881820 [Suillus ampliporus]|nr:hypothetical protein DFH29DRAFT_881820 [Suillus ampliporus]
MTSKKFPMSRPILLQDIERTPEDRKAIAAWQLAILHAKRLGHQVMFPGSGSRMITVPNQYAQAVQVVIHQNRVYRTMMVRCEEQANKGLIDPADVKLYANVAAYLRDVLCGFEEECDEYTGTAGPFRSARLDFHFALVIAGKSSFTPGSARKLEKKLGVTWESILRGEEVPEIEKRNDLPPHSCCTTLKSYGSARRSSISCIDFHDMMDIHKMIDRFVGERVDEFKSKAAMALEKGTGEKGNPKEVVPAEKGKGKEVVPVEKGKGKEVVRVDKGKGKEVVPANKGKGKEVVPADKGKRKAISRTTPVEEGRSQTLTIKLPGSGPRGVQKQGTTNQKDSTKKQAKSGGNHSDDQTASATRSTQIAAQEALDQFSAMDISSEKDTRGKDKSSSSNPGKDRQGKGVANRSSKAPTVDAQSEDRTGSAIDKAKAAGNDPLKDTGTSGQGGLVGSVDTGFTSIEPIPGPLKKVWLEMAMDEADGTRIGNNLGMWLTTRFRFLAGIPVEGDVSGQLIPQSPDAYPFPHYDDYLEALGLERLYAALRSAEETTPRFEPLEPLPANRAWVFHDNHPTKNVVADAEDPIEDEVEVSEMVEQNRADGDVDGVSDRTNRSGMVQRVMNSGEGGEDVEEDGPGACAGTMGPSAEILIAGALVREESPERALTEKANASERALSHCPPKARSGGRRGTGQETSQASNKPYLRSLVVFWGTSERGGPPTHSLKLQVPPVKLPRLGILIQTVATPASVESSAHAYDIHFVPVDNVHARSASYVQHSTEVITSMPDNTLTRMEDITAECNCLKQGRRELRSTRLSLFETSKCPSMDSVRDAERICPDLRGHVGLIDLRRSGP